MEETEVEIETLERESRSLQAQGKYLESLEALEAVLEKRRALFGADSQPASQTCMQLCELANHIAVKYLQKDDFQMALDLLRRAEVLAERLDDGKAITYNNYACYYRRMGKTKLALSYLHKAQSLEERSSLSHSPANTHLNMCAVLSQVSKHDQALEQAMAAIIILQGELMDMKQEDQGFREKAEFMAMAFHNMAVEMEYLKRVRGM